MTDLNKPMRIAIASGKGGTGKTTIATSLALYFAETQNKVVYIDCDVEEPNGHIFLKPKINNYQKVNQLIPEINTSVCTLCGECSKVCRYSAIAVLPNKVLTFPKLCHSCGGCYYACLHNAIKEVPNAIGTIEQGYAGEVEFLQGKLNVGEAMAPPVIRSLLAMTPQKQIIIIDAPPGTSCPVIESVKDSDFVLLVTEPTPFGLNDLQLAVETIRKLGIPFGVIINRCDIGNNKVRDYCNSEKIPVLMAIPNSRTIASAYSQGTPAILKVPELKNQFADLLPKITHLLKNTVATLNQLHLRNEINEFSNNAPNSTDDTLPSQIKQIGNQRNIRELVVISGKGGTGKTSISASLFALADNALIVDCDVDAANLHLLLNPNNRHQWSFFGGNVATIDPIKCNKCNKCKERCRFDAISSPAENKSANYIIDPISCEGCGVCVDSCPQNAIELHLSDTGKWFIADTRLGSMIHARLNIAAENSGKLVSLIRHEAKAFAGLNGNQLIICDGPPGIGCPVIASITLADFALIVTEATLSGLHDLIRVIDLCQQMKVKTGICINKADINLEISNQIEVEAQQRNIPILGRISYDDAVTKAQIQNLTIVENNNTIIAKEIKKLWAQVTDALNTVTI